MFRPAFDKERWIKQQKQTNQRNVVGTLPSATSTALAGSPTTTTTTTQTLSFGAKLSPVVSSSCSSTETPKQTPKQHQQQQQQPLPQPRPSGTSIVFAPSGQPPAQHNEIKKPQVPGGFAAPKKPSGFRPPPKGFSVTNALMQMMVDPDDGDNNRDEESGGNQSYGSDKKTSFATSSSSLKRKWPTESSFSSQRNPFPVKAFATYGATGAKDSGKSKFHNVPCKPWEDKTWISDKRYDFSTGTSPEQLKYENTVFEYEASVEERCEKRRKMSEPQPAPSASSPPPSTPHEWPFGRSLFGGVVDDDIEDDDDMEESDDKPSGPPVINVKNIFDMMMRPGGGQKDTQGDGVGGPEKGNKRQNKKKQGATDGRKKVYLESNYSHGSDISRVATIGAYYKIPKSALTLEMMESLKSELLAQPTQKSAAFQGPQKNKKKDKQTGKKPKGPISINRSSNDNHRPGSDLLDEIEDPDVIGGSENGNACDGREEEEAQEEEDDRVNDGSFPVWIDEGDFFYVPRFVGIRKWGVAGAKVELSTGLPFGHRVPPEERLPPSKGKGRGSKKRKPEEDSSVEEPVTISFKGSLRADKPQKEAIESVFHSWGLESDASVRLDPRTNEPAFCPGGNGAILSLPCGYGKTVCALYIAYTLKRKAIVLVHTDDLEGQWQDRIREFLPGCRVGSLRGQIVDVQDRDIVVCTLQSLAQKAYPEELLRQFGLVIVDESHHIGARTFSTAIRKLPCAYVLGLSATPRRRDGLTKLLFWLMGDMAMQVEREDDKQVLVRTVVFTEGKQREVLTNGEANTAIMKNILAAEITRNHLIIHEVEQLLKQGRYVMAVSDRTFHLDMLEGCFQGEYTVDKYHSKMKKAPKKKKPEEEEEGDGGSKQKKSKKKGTESPPSTEQPKKDAVAKVGAAGEECARLVLRTFQMAEEGFDRKRLDALVILTSHSDPEQVVGRIQRDHPEKMLPLVVVDIVDPFSKFINQYQYRERFYKKQRFEIQQVNSSDFDYRQWGDKHRHSICETGKR